MTKTYDLPNEKIIMADVDEKHHMATVSVYALDDLVEAVNKTGTWEEDIDNSRKWDKVRFYCSECGNWQTYGKTDYCPKCGCRMVEPQERSDKCKNCKYYSNPDYERCHICKAESEE